MNNSIKYDSDFCYYPYVSSENQFVGQFCDDVDDKYNSIAIDGPLTPQNFIVELIEIIKTSTHSHLIFNSQAKQDEIISKLNDALQLVTFQKTYSELIDQ